MQKTMRFNQLACALVWWLLVWYSGRACARETCSKEGLEPAWGQARSDYSVDTYTDRYMGEDEVFALFRAVVCGAQQVMNKYRGEATEELLAKLLDARHYTEFWGHLLLGVQALMLLAAALLAACCRRCGCACPRLDAEQPGRQGGRVEAGAVGGRVSGPPQPGSRGLWSGQVPDSLPQLQSSPPRARDRVSLFNMGRPAVRQPGSAPGSVASGSASVSALPTQVGLQYGDLFSPNVLLERLGSTGRDSLSFQSSFTFGDQFHDDEESSGSMPDLEYGDDDRVWREGADVMESSDMLVFSMESETVPAPPPVLPAEEPPSPPATPLGMIYTRPTPLQPLAALPIELLAAQQQQVMVDAIVTNFLREMEVEEVSRESEVLEAERLDINVCLEDLYERTDREFKALHERRDKLSADLSKLDSRMDAMLNRTGPWPGVRPVAGMGEASRRVTNMAERMEVCKEVALSHSRVSSKEAVLMEEYARQHSTVGWQLYSKRLGLSGQGMDSSARRASQQQDLDNFLALTERVAASLLDKVNELSVDQNLCRSEVMKGLRVECASPVVVEMPDEDGVEEMQESHLGSRPVTPDLSLVAQFSMDEGADISTEAVVLEMEEILLCSRPCTPDLTGMPGMENREPVLLPACRRAGLHICPAECGALLMVQEVDSEEEISDFSLEKEDKDEV